MFAPAGFVKQGNSFFRPILLKHIRFPRASKSSSSWQFCPLRLPAAPTNDVSSDCPWRLWKKSQIHLPRFSTLI